MLALRLDLTCPPEPRGRQACGRLRPEVELQAKYLLVAKPLPQIACPLQRTLGGGHSKADHRSRDTAEVRRALGAAAEHHDAALESIGLTVRLLLDLGAQET